MAGVYNPKAIDGGYLYKQKAGYRLGVGAILITPSPTVTISGPEGTLVITPMSIETGQLQRFQIASWRGGSQLGRMRAGALLRDIQFDSRAMSELTRLFAAVHETAGPSAFDMVQKLTYDLELGGKFHAFYIPPPGFGHFAVAQPPDVNGLLADPPGVPATWSVTARIAAMLRRVPAHVGPELLAQVEELLRPRSIALLAIFLSALAISQAFGVGEIVDAVLAGIAWRLAGWVGLMAVKDIVMSVIDAGRAQSTAEIDKAAALFARGLLVLGLLFLSKLIDRAGDEENVGEAPAQQKAEPLPARGSTNDIMKRYAKQNEDVTYPRGGFTTSAGQPWSAASTKALAKQGWPDAKLEEIEQSGSSPQLTTMSPGDSVFKIGNSSLDPSIPSPYLLNQDGVNQLITNGAVNPDLQVVNPAQVKQTLALPCYNMAQTIFQGTVTEPTTAVVSTINPASELFSLGSSSGTPIAGQLLMTGGGSQAAIDPTAISFPK